MSFSRRITEQQYVELLDICNKKYKSLNSSQFSYNLNVIIKLKGRANIKIPILITFRKLSKFSDINIKADYSKIYIFLIVTWLSIMLFFTYFNSILFGAGLGLIITFISYISIQSSVENELNTFGKDLTK